jgi:GNAT superfamily N-acetyltransferase
MINQRVKESVDKAEKAIKKQFGETTHDMMYLDTIFTDPDYQRRGWGGKLIESMNDIVRLHSSGIRLLIRLETL